MAAVCGSHMCVTTQMTVVTTATSEAAPSPRVILPLSLPAPAGAASVQTLSVMASMTVETTPLTKSTAVSDD